MAHESLAMSETKASTTTTEQQALDAAVGAVAAKKTEFARLPVRARIDLLKAMIPTTQASLSEWIHAACQAKGLREDAPVAGEEWLGGPLLVMRNLRLLIESLEQIARAGKPELGKAVRTRPDGRVEVDVFPASAIDGVLFQGFSGYILLQEGMTEREAREKQASFYSRKDPVGGVTLVLGAGNVSSIAPMDAFYKLFVEGNVCVIKMNPVNEYLGPAFEKAFAPLIARDYLRIVYGGGDVGAYLCQHPLIEDIHITGSDRTHDLIVWGPPGPDRERRKLARDPLLKKTITSELGNVSPVLVVPASYSDAQLRFVANNVASQITNNASFNCNAAKMLVTQKSWGQTETFLGYVKESLAKVEPRVAYYPGADDRYAKLTGAGHQVAKIGEAGPGRLPWTIITGLDATKTEMQFDTEPFCAILSHVALDTQSPEGFLKAATEFANDKLWGTLNACIIIPSQLEKDATVGKALDRAILDLRYGTVAVNHWPAIGYGFVTLPWGGHPSATLANIQSGLGWVHNTYMLEGIEKAVVRGPLTLFPKPPWFNDHAKTHEIGPKLVAMEAHPSWLRVPGIVLLAMRG